MDECKALDVGAGEEDAVGPGPRLQGRGGLNSFPFPLNLSLICPFPLNLSLFYSPHNPKITRGCVPRALKLSSNVKDVFPMVLELSSEVSECKPLGGGPDGGD